MFFRVIRLVVSKTNNGKAVWLYSDVGTVSQTVRSGNGLDIEKMSCPPRALLTVFSITQSDHSISLLSIHDYMDLEMSPDNS